MSLSNLEFARSWNSFSNKNEEKFRARTPQKEERENQGNFENRDSEKGTE